MNRYAAKLLFQFRRGDEKGRALRRRVCEERIIHLMAVGDEEALAKADIYGRDSEYRDTEMGRDVWFEFVGVIDIDEVFVCCGDDTVEVWWELYERVLPMERRDRFVPGKERLRLFRGVPSGVGRMKI